MESRVVPANGVTIANLDPFYESLAFWTDLIDLEDNSVDTTTGWYEQDTGLYISHISGNSSKLQSKNSYTSGGKNEFVFS